MFTNLLNAGSNSKRAFRMFEMRCFTSGAGIVFMGIFFLLNAMMFAVEIPEGMNYQGLLLDSVGSPLPDGEYGLRFTVWTQEEGGSMLWGPQVCEGVNNPENGLHPKVLLKNGEFHQVMGPKDTDGDEISTAFTDDTTWLQIEVTIDKDGNPVADGVIKPRQRFLAAPYAFYSRRIPKVDPDVVNKTVTVDDTMIVQSDVNGGRIQVENSSGNTVIDLNGNNGWIESSGLKTGTFFLMNGPNAVARLEKITDGEQFYLYSPVSFNPLIGLIGNNNGGELRCYDTAGVVTCLMNGNGPYGGFLNLYNHSGQPLMAASHSGGSHTLDLYNPYGARCISLSGTSGGKGYLYLLNNGSSHVELRPGYFYLNNYPGATDMVLRNDPWLHLYDDGDIWMYDSSGVNQIHIYVTGGKGYIYGDVKSFQITHPTKPGMLLNHACIEGPETAVYYRGEAQLNGKVAEIALPEYFEALTRKEGRTVQLTCKNGWSPIFYEDIIDGKFKVKTTDQGNPSQEFSWEVKAIRADVEPLQTEISEQKTKALNSSHMADQRHIIPDENIQTE